MSAFLAADVLQPTSSSDPGSVYQIYSPAGALQLPALPGPVYRTVPAPAGPGAQPVTGGHRCGPQPA